MMTDRTENGRKKHQNTGGRRDARRVSRKGKAPGAGFLRSVLPLLLVLALCAGGCGSKAGSGRENPAQEGAGTENSAQAAAGTENTAQAEAGTENTAQAEAGMEKAAPSGTGGESAAQTEGQETAPGGSGGAEENAAGAEAGTGAALPAEGSGAAGEKLLTLMVYLCGSDLESKAGAATSDLNEILASGVNVEKVNVVVMTGGTTKWQNGFPDGETAVYSLAAGDSPAEPASSGSTEAAGEDASAAGSAALSAGGIHWEKARTYSAPDSDAPANMGEKETLGSFLQYSYDQYPAEDYALIMWDHGGGPMRGLCWDTAWGKDNLTMEEFTGALEASPFQGRKLAWMGFDACLMSSIETAHLIAPYADYMIASEETEPSLGWSYEFLDGIENDRDGAETGKRIIDAYFEAGERSGKKSAMTLACSDLSRVGDVEEKLNRFAGKLSASLVPESFSDLSNQRQNTKEFGKAITDSQRMDLVDLGDLATGYSGEAPEEAKELENAIRQMVLYSRSTMQKCCGLSAYHPYYNKAFYEKVWQKEYDTFHFAASYTDYLHSFADIWLGDAMGDWSEMNEVQAAGSQEETQLFSLQLTPEQMAYYSSAELLILETIGTEDSMSGIGYAQMYRTEDVTVDENGVLTAGYNGRTLYVTDAEGEIIGGPVNYSYSDEGNIQIRGNYLNYESGTERTVTAAMFECGDAPSGTDLEILERYIYDEDAQMWSNRLEIREEQFQTLNILFDFKKMSYDDQSRLLPFSEWEDSSWLGGYSIDLPEEVHFRFMDQNLAGKDLLACFQIYDTQANAYGTALMPVGNQYADPILFQEGTKNGSAAGNDSAAGEGSGTDGGEICTMETELLRMTVSGQLKKAEYASQMELNLRVENLSGKPLSGGVQGGVILQDDDHTRVCVSPEGNIRFTELEPGKGETYPLVYSREQLAELSQIRQISLTMQVQEADSGDGSGEAAADPDPAEAGTGAEIVGEGGTSSEVSYTAASGSAEAVPAQEENRNEVTFVVHPVDLDLRTLFEEGQPGTGIAEAAQDGLHWTLLGASRKRNGDIETMLLCRNESDDDRSLQAPSETAVNGVALPCWSIFSMESFALPPGMEIAFPLTLQNESSDHSYYEHLSGSEHLRIEDLLGSAGVQDLQFLTLYFHDFIVGWTKAEDCVLMPPVRFDLETGVAFNRMMSGEEETSGDGAGASGEKTDAAQTEAETDDTEAGPGEQEPEEEMTRALDEDGRIPERTMLYADDDLTVYGEQILIADRTMLLSLFVENAGKEDAVLRFYHWSVNGVEVRDYFDSPDNCLIGASTRKRIILNRDFSLEETEDSISTISVFIRQESKNGKKTAQDAQDPIPDTRELVFTFEEGTAFDLDGGVTVPVEKTDPKITSLSEGVDSSPVFSQKVSCPPNPEKYRKTLTFSIPASMPEEERTSVTGVFAIICRDRSGDLDDLSPEDRQKAEISAQVLSFAPLRAAEGQKGVYTGTYSGLVCVSGEEPSVAFATMEVNQDVPGIVLNSVINGYMNSASLKLKEAFRTEYSESAFDFAVTLSEEKGETSAALSAFSFQENYEGVKIPDLPAGCFESLEYSMGAPFFAKGENGSLEYRTWGLEGGSGSIPLNGGSLSLSLIPAAEYDSRLRVLYVVSFADDSYRYYDGGAFQ